MNLYNVQVATDIGEELVIEVNAESEAEAEMTAIEMVEDGQTEAEGVCVVDCSCIN